MKTSILEKNKSEYKNKNNTFFLQANYITSYQNLNHIMKTVNRVQSISKIRGSNRMEWYYHFTHSLF